MCPRPRRRRARDATVLLYGHLDKQPEMIGWLDGLRPVDSALRGRQALRPRRRRRRVRGVRVARGDRRAAGAGHSACALRRHDRDVRGVGQLRSAGLPRAPGAAPGARRFRRRPRFRLRRLRAAVGDDVAARYRRRHADRRGADRRRAFGRCERHRAVVVPDRAASARPARGFGDRPHPARRIPRADSRGARGAGARGGRHHGRARDPQVSVCRRHEADGGGPRRSAAQSHVASRAFGHRRRRPAVDRERRQRAAAAHVAQAVAADPADARRRARDQPI